MQRQRLGGAMHMIGLELIHPRLELPPPSELGHSKSVKDRSSTRPLDAAQNLFRQFGRNAMKKTLDPVLLGKLLLQMKRVSLPTQSLGHQEENARLAHTLNYRIEPSRTRGYGWDTLTLENSNRRERITMKFPVITTLTLVCALASAQTKPPTDTVELRDPVEDAYTVKLPKGWNNRTYSARAYDTHRMVSLTVSPNGDTVIFYGDPSLPNYYVPEYAHEMIHYFARVNPLMKIESYRPAKQFINDYTKQKFGQLSDFKLTKVEDDPATVKVAEEAFAKAGLNVELSAAKAQFTFTDKGTTMNAFVMLMIAFNGTGYTVDVGGISTNGNAKDFEPTLVAIRNSVKMNPKWQALQQQLHQQRMAEIEAHTQLMMRQHSENMALIQASAERHQQRMQAMWSANDASMASYWQKSAANDLQHQNFINFINDENTVVTSTGKTLQVQTGYEKYFWNKHNNSYVGGHGHWDMETLRKMGLNPDDYEEVKIKKK